MIWILTGQWSDTRMKNKIKISLKVSRSLWILLALVMYMHLVVLHFDVQGVNNVEIKSMWTSLPWLSRIFVGWSFKTRWQCRRHVRRIRWRVWVGGNYYGSVIFGISGVGWWGLFEVEMGVDSNWGGSINMSIGGFRVDARDDSSLRGRLCR